VYRDKQNDSEACGNISYLLWGGLAALGWSKNKLRELGELEENEISIPNSSYPGESNEMISGSTNLNDVRKIMFPTEEMAEEFAEMIGCSGSHPHETVDQGTYYMPCKTHPKD
jgi:hypothetical protein